MFRGLAGFWVNLILAIFALAGAAVCIFIFNEPVGQSLRIRDSASGKVYGAWPLEAGGEFSVEFIHSVHNSPVRETFRTTGGRVQVESVRFFAFGAGMLSDLEEGQTLGRDGDALVISGFNRSPVKELHYVVGTVSDHLLLINGETISLEKLCGKNAGITIQINTSRGFKRNN